MYINGEWTDGSGNEREDVVNPATGEVVEQVPRGNKQDVDAAVQAADDAFEAWSHQSADRRAEYLEQAADLAQERKREMARTLTREQGKPVNEAEGGVGGAIKALRYYARQVRDLKGEIYPNSSDNVRSLVQKQPLGPVATIAPWNYPVLLMTWKVAPALAAGCTVVAKPPTKTPLAVTAMIECLDEANLPDGVVNLVTGRGSEVGEALTSHPRISKIAFTGETGTGRHIMRNAAEDVKNLTLELGGHCPLIVNADANLEKAAEAGVYRSFRNMGQICNSINRIYVDEEVHDDFVERFVTRTEKLSIANGLEDPDADLGSMLEPSGVEKTRRHIQDALDKGAVLECGGEAPEGEEYENGNFYKPTVLTHVDHEMVVMNEETFGPVAPIMAVSDPGEAVERANDSIYGLVAYLFTEDLDQGLDMADELEYGTVGINNVSGGDAPYPYSGWKQSGLGVENSDYGLEEYYNIKHIRATSLD